jgi:fermentation-respiration switch protein FrsA (DUF1100 family)
MPRLKLTMLYYALGIIAVLWALLNLMAQWFSDNLIYQPPGLDPELPASLGFYLKITSEINIHAVYLPNPQAHFTLLYSHGNAENLASILPLLHHYHQMGYAVISYDYEGYGKSSGQSIETNIYRNIEAIYQYLRKEQQLSPQQIVIYGRSLGTGPSMELALRQPVAGLILEAPFTSIYRVITHWPILFGDKFNNLAKAPLITVPTLVIHGKQDQVVSFSHGLQIYQSLKSSKQSYWITQAGHNDIIYLEGPRYWQRLEQFLSPLLLPERSESVHVLPQDENQSH